MNTLFYYKIPVLDDTIGNQYRLQVFLIMFGDAKRVQMIAFIGVVNL